MPLIEFVTAAEPFWAAAREINYHFVRGHHFDVPKAALYKCLLNLVSERPEKFRL